MESRMTRNAPAHNRPQPKLVRLLLIVCLLAIGASLGSVSQALPQEEYPMVMKASKTLFFGAGVLDLLVSHKTVSGPAGEKVDADIQIVPGGGVVNAGLAYQQAGGQPPLLAVITGADETGNLLTRMLNSQTRNVRRIAAGTRTRISAIVPSGKRPSETVTWTIRPELDEAHVFTALEPLLSQCERLVLYSFTAQQTPFVERVADAFTGEIWLCPTGSQCDDRTNTLRLLRKCTGVVLNATELQRLVPERSDLVSRMYRLHEQGIADQFVTASERGIYTRRTGQSAFAKAFEVLVNGSTSKCGDVAIGTWLSALDQGEPLSEATRLASAAGAMQAAGMPRALGLPHLQSFADTTPTRWFRPVTDPQPRVDVPAVLTRTARRMARPAAYASGGAVAAATVLLALRVGFGL